MKMVFVGKMVEKHDFVSQMAVKTRVCEAHLSENTFLGLLALKTRFCEENVRGRNFVRQLAEKTHFCETCGGGNTLL